MYWFLSYCMRLAIRIYFKKIEVKGWENLPQDKPILLTPNHPSGFMDPILIGAVVKRPVHFISRGESFVKPLQRWFFSKLHMLPVYRPDKTRHLIHKNKGVFKSCYQILEQNGAIIIFPEGLSHMEPRLIKTKTGASRIALGAENQHNFELDVHIVPIGLNYSNAHKFRSSVCVNIGQSIPAKKYQEHYQKKPQEAARALTADIRQSIIGNSVHIYQEDRFETYDMLLKSHILLPEDYASTLPIINDLDNIELNVLNKALYELHYLKKQLNINGNYQRIVRWKWSQILQIPMAALGIFLNYIPYKLTGIFTDNVIKRPDFRGSFLLVAGFFIFAIYYLLTGLLIGSFSSWWLSLIYIGTSVLSGFSWLRLIHHYRAWKNYRAYQKSLTQQTKRHEQYCRIIVDVRKMLRKQREAA